MITTFTVVHLIVCFVLILVVLLQTGKGSDMGAVFGGSSQTVFGSSGAAPFLSKFTTGAAIVFMLTSLVLATLSAEPESSLMDEERPAPASIPAMPAPEPLVAPIPLEPIAPAAQEAPLASATESGQTPTPATTPAAQDQPSPAIPKAAEQTPAATH